MEQNDIVAKILQMLQGRQRAPQPPMLAQGPVPPRPAGIMPPSGPEMPESNDRIALSMALGLNPEFPDYAHDLNAPEVQALIAEQRKLMGPSQMSPQMRQFMELQKLQRPQQQQFTLPRPGPHSMIR